MPQVRNPFVHFDVKLNGVLLSEEQRVGLVHIVVDHRMRVPDLVSLAFHDPERTLLDDTTFSIGNEVVVQVRTGARPVELFKGEITALEIEYDSAGMHAVVRGLDRCHRLTHGHRTASYQNMTYADIVKKIGTAAGLSVQADATQPVVDHMLQYNQSDWSFLTEIAAEIGYDLWVEQGALKFKKPPPASAAPSPGDLQASNPLQLVLGENLRSVRAVATTNEQVGQAEVRGWDPKQKRELVATRSAPKPDGAANGVPEAKLKSFNGSVAAAAVRTPYALQAAADAASEAFAQEIASTRVEIEGVALGEATLRAGSTISIGQAGTQFNGRYTVTATRHVYEPGEGYRTEFTVSGRQDRSLRGLVNGSAVSPNGGAHRSVAGVVPAIVTNNTDPDNLGRVKVKFPWLVEGHESTWARPVQLLAGASYGCMFIPEVNDEVLVAFAHGDVNSPYVVGSLYNGKDKPQKATSAIVTNGKVTQRRIETPTLNRLVFFDHKGTKEGVTLRTGDDKYFIELNKTNTKIVVSSNGDVLIEAKTGKVDITSQQDMTIKAGKNLNLEATGNTTIKGTQVEVAAKAAMKLQASGPLEAKGAIIKLN